MEDAEQNLNLALGQLLLEEEELKYKVMQVCSKNRFQKFNDELASSSLKLVHRAYDAQQGRQVLWHSIKVKRIPKRQLIKIMRDLALMKQLKHKNLINCLDYWIKSEEKEIVFITELIEGDTLKNYLDKIKTAKFKVIKGWCHQILKGIAYLHQQQKPVIHKSLRSDNVYINSSTNEIKIGQVGVLFTPYTPFQSIGGSYQSIAPQVNSGKKLRTPADIYSFGMILLQLFTGQKSYSECKNDHDIVRTVTQKIKPSSLQLITHPELKKIIQSCLSYDPKSRPTAQDLLVCNFWKADDEIDVNSFKVIFQSNSQQKISKKFSKQSQTFYKEVKLAQGILKRQSSCEIKYIFNLQGKNKYEITFQRQNDQQFQEFINYFTKKLQDKHTDRHTDKHTDKESMNQPSKEFGREQNAHLLSYNNPTMKTIRLDQFYQSRIKWDDNKKSTINFSQLNQAGQTDIFYKIQENFAAAYEVYRNKIEFQNLEELHQQTRFMIEIKELDELQSIQKQKIKLRKNISFGNKGYLAHSMNLIDFLNNSQSPWPNEAYDVEKETIFKHTLLDHPYDLSSLNFSSIYNIKQQVIVNFQLQNARYVLEEENLAGNQNLNKSFVIQQNIWELQSKISFFEASERLEQKQKMLKNDQQQKFIKQLFQKKCSYKKQKQQQDMLDSKITLT